MLRQLVHVKKKIDKKNRLSYTPVPDSYGESPISPPWSGCHTIYLITKVAHVSSFRHYIFHDVELLLLVPPARRPSLAKILHLSRQNNIVKKTQSNSLVHHILQRKHVSCIYPISSWEEGS